MIKLRLLLFYLNIFKCLVALPENKIFLNIWLCLWKYFEKHTHTHTHIYIYIYIYLSLPHIFWTPRQVYNKQIPIKKKVERERKRMME